MKDYNPMAALRGCYQYYSQDCHPERDWLIQRLNNVIKNKYKLMSFGYLQRKSSFQCLLCHCIFHRRARFVIHHPNSIMCPNCIKYVKKYVKTNRKFFKHRTLINYSVLKEINIKHQSVIPYFKKHLKILDLDDAIYGIYKNCSRKRITLQCTICHTIFNRILQHTDIDPVRCPVCNSRISSGELIVLNYLNNKGIKFIYGYVTHIKYKKYLHFDFWLPESKTAIEYDGREHFEPVSHFGGVKSFKAITKRNSIKNKYCKQHHINLIRINYHRSIKKILDQKLNWIQLSLF